MKKALPYNGDTFLLVTKHEKAKAINPSFKEKLNARVLEYVIDTDILGTFSGEIERQGTALDCARAKCEKVIQSMGKDAELVLASEGSFGPHPLIQFIPCDYEILYFIDQKRGFHIHVSMLSEATNYQVKEVKSFQELEAFASKVQFPSHALIIRSDSRDETGPIFKGINTQEALKDSFERAIRLSKEGKALVETDMRACFNPSRMKVIGLLAEKLADRLAILCPKCDTPGWGKVRVEKGLKCGWCYLETELIKLEIFGCAKCDYEEFALPSHGLKKADPGSCSYCNP